MKHREGILIVISGFSGAGKGTLVKRLISDYDNYALSISMTTRQPRNQERDGIEYFFVTKEKFEQTIAEGGLLEHASYCDNYYGTPKAYVEEQLSLGKDVILEIDVQGALQIREKFANTLLLFVTPPSAAELKNRLQGRQTETEEVINKRLSRAGEEVTWMKEYDFIVVNDDLDECVKETNSIIETAHCAPFRCGELINDLENELKSFSKGDK